MENLRKQTNDFLRNSQIQLGWNSVLEALIFKMGIKTIWEEALTAYYSFFYDLWSLFLKLFGNDLKFAHFI